MIFHRLRNAADSAHIQRGGSLVEFALVAPIALMFLLGAVQLGIVGYRYHSLDYAARAAARWAAVRGSNCTYTSGTDAAGNTLCPASGAAVAYYVQTSVPGILPSASPSPLWTMPSSSSYVQQPTICDSTHQTQGCLVKVTVSETFTISFPFVRTIPYTLTSTATEVVQ